MSTARERAEAIGWTIIEGRKTNETRRNHSKRPAPVSPPVVRLPERGVSLGVWEARRRSQKLYHADAYENYNADGLSDLLDAIRHADSPGYGDGNFDPHFD